MKTYLFSILLIFVLDSVNNGQALKNDGLVLTASLTSVTAKLNTTTDKPLFRYELQLIMQLRNDSNETLFVFKPLSDIVEKRIAFMSDLSGSGVGSYGLRPGPWISNAYRYRAINPRYDPFADLARGLDFPEPVSNALLRIEPGRYHEYIEVITVDDGYRLEIKPGQSLREVSSNPPLAEDPAFKIQYHLSLKKHHKNDALLSTLQLRWKRFGHLVLDSNGDFLITSEDIINRSGS
jgi:hypothetical protein